MSDTARPLALHDDPPAGPDRLIEAANALVPVLAERAAAAETARRLPEETISDLLDAGLIQMRLPTQLGGSGSDMLTETLVSAALAPGCAATSWVRAILSGGAGAAARLPPAGVDEVFGSGRVPLVCGVTTLGGVARLVADGVVVSGSWGFASGCLHADWAGVGVRFEGGPDAPTGVDGEPLPTVGAVMIPMADLEIKDTWHVAGLCATGSNTLVAKEVFVPSHRLLTVPNALVAMLERSPQVPRFAVALLGTLLGAAEGLLAAVADNATKRGISYFHYERQADSDAFAMRIGESAMRIDTAWLHARRAIADLAAEATDGPMSYLHSTRGQADSGYAAILLRETASTLVSLAGGSSFATTNAMQRAWRDITVGCSHAMLNGTASLELHGRALLGRESNSPFWGPDASFLA